MNGALERQGHSSWPPGDGDMVRRVRIHDWAETPLGSVIGWSERFKLMVEIVLACPEVSCLVCGPRRILIYNDAAARLYGPHHPSALSRPLSEAFPEGWATVAPLYATAFSGEVVQITAQPLDTRGEGRATEIFDAMLMPMRDEVGAITAVMMTGREVGVRVRADNALRIDEQRFHALVTATSYAVYSMGPDWREMRQLEGYGFLADTAVPSTSWMDEYILPDDHALVGDAIQQAIKTKALFELEHRVRRANGEVGWTLSRAVPIADNAGNVREWFGAASDVTTRKHMEAALRDSEERFQRFGEASQDVLWIREVGSLQWEYLTSAFEAIYGMSREEALHGDNLANWARMILPEDRGRALASIRRVAEGHRVVFEYRIRRPSDGQIRWLRDTDFPIRDAVTGQVHRIGGVGQDVTALKEAEAALANSEARLRTLVEGMPQLVWRSVARGDWTWASPQWTSFTGLSNEASFGRGWFAAVHPDDRAGATAAWDRAGEDGLFEASYRLRCASNGAWRWFQTRGLPVSDARRNGAVEWLGTSTDVDDHVLARDVLERAAAVLEARIVERTAELQAAEANLRQSQKMEAVGQLTGGIAHDFNNMLQGVAGGVEMARRRVVAGRAEEAERYLEAAREAVERASGLTRRLLAFARQQRLEPRPIDVDALIAGMADLVRRTVGPGIALELRLRNGLGMVLCDPNELENVLLNLCINARDAMPEGGLLTVCTDDVHLAAADIPGGEVVPGRYVEILVTDSGTGMPPEVLERVFDPFFTTKPVGQGTGLGLSQVWGFVRQSDGLVRAESTPGHGTTFHLLLPFSTRVDTASEPGVELLPHLETNGTILLVEDEDGVRSLVADHLRELGLTVLEARNGSEAVLILGRSRPDLLVTDVGLPGGMDGRRVAEAAKEAWPGLSVLFMTGYGANVSLPAGAKMVAKPFALEELARKIGEILEAKAD